MYKDYFGFSDLPFSIAPDPNYLYLSEQHKEALAHLLYGVGDQGGFVLLSGEVGTGKTTICRALLHQMPERCEVAYVVNPRQTETELLRSICDEFGIYYFYEGQGSNYLVDLINEHLLALHAKGRNAVLIIDEAQNLGVEVLEQLRLLTNLETDQKKLLQLILLGQPELNELLAKTELRQLAQRITARHHLKALTETEVAAYIEHRLQVAGFRGALFGADAIKIIYRKSGGIPRLVNVICDRCLLGVYSVNGNEVTSEIAKQAVSEALGSATTPLQGRTITENLKALSVPLSAIAGVFAVVLFGVILFNNISSHNTSPEPEKNESSGMALNEPSTLKDNVAAKQTERENSSVNAQQQLLFRLAKRFGYDGVTSADACNTMKIAGLSCVARNSDLKTILLLETTILAKLPNRVLPENQIEDQDGSQWVLLTAVSGEPMEIEFANQQRVALPPATLSEAWPIDYFWLWRPPQSYRQNLSLGEADEFVSWLNRALKAYEQDKQLESHNFEGSEGSSVMLQRSGFLLSAGDSDANSVVSTGLLRAIARVKQQLNLRAPGVPQELAYVLGRPMPSSLERRDNSDLALHSNRSSTITEDQQ